MSVRGQSSSQKYMRLFTLPAAPWNKRKLQTVSPCNPEEPERQKLVTCQGCVAESTLSVVRCRVANIPGRIYPVEQTSLWTRYEILTVLILQTYLGRKTLEMGFTLSKGLSGLPLVKGWFYLLLHRQQSKQSPECF